MSMHLFAQSASLCNMNGKTAANRSMHTLPRIHTLIALATKRVHCEFDNTYLPKDTMCCHIHNNKSIRCEQVIAYLEENKYICSALDKEVSTMNTSLHTLPRTHSLAFNIAGNRRDRQTRTRHMN